MEFLEKWYNITKDWPKILAIIPILIAIILFPIFLAREEFQKIRDEEEEKYYKNLK